MSAQFLCRPLDLAVVDEASRPDEPARVYLADLRHERIISLSSSAAEIWRQAQVGEVITLASRVAAVYGVLEADISSDVMACVDSLVARGLLARADSADPGA